MGGGAAGSGEHGEVDAFTEFVVYGWVDAQPSSAYWAEGQLSADAALWDRAQIVVALGEQSAGPRSVRAALDGGPRAALFTVVRAFSEVSHVAVWGADTPPRSGGSIERAWSQRGMDLLSADPFDLPLVVVDAPAHLDPLRVREMDRELGDIQVNADVVVDLAAVESCSLPALLVLDTARQRFTGSGGSFRLRRPTPVVWRLLRSCGMADRFAIETVTDGHFPDE
jgi:anti-anti-sigma regulatory factor